jgi:hypothetical protein
MDWMGLEKILKKFDLFGIQTHPIPLNPHGLRANRTSPYVAAAMARVSSNARRYPISSVASMLQRLRIMTRGSYYQLLVYVEPRRREVTVFSPASDSPHPLVTPHMRWPQAPSGEYGEAPSLGPENPTTAQARIDNSKSNPRPQVRGCSRDSGESDITPSRPTVAVLGWDAESRSRRLGSYTQVRVQQPALNACAPGIFSVC